MTNVQPAELSVLWVEDDDGVAAAFTRILHAQDVQVVRVADLAEARAALDGSARFDVVLLDLNLPSSQGIETVRFFRRLSALPIVVLTGIVDTDDRLAQLALLEGAQDWLAKASFAATGPQLTRALRLAVARDKFAKARAAS